MYAVRRVSPGKGGVAVSRHRSLMSDVLKHEIAKELGVYSTVESEGWGAVSSRDCGNIVKKAIEMAERSLDGK
jgi:small acid-soluble spore protein F (minor alpha/beta-type SASP)